MRLNFILIFLVIFLLFKKTNEMFVLKKNCLRGKQKNSPNSKQCGNYSEAAKKFFRCGECIRNINMDYKDGNVCTTDPIKLDKALINLNLPSQMYKDGKKLSKVNTECLMSGLCDDINTNKQVMEEVVKKCCGTYERKGSRWVKRKDEDTTPDTYQYGAICNLTNAEIDDKVKLLNVV